MQLYIRVIVTDDDRHIGYAICSTNSPPLIDEQIKAHYPVETTGREMKADFPTAEWGNVLLCK